MVCRLGIKYQKCKPLCLILTINQTMIKLCNSPTSLNALEAKEKPMLTTKVKLARTNEN